MDRPSTPMEHGDSLERIVASSRSSGRAYVVLALGLVEDNAGSAALVAATDSALAVVTGTLGIDAASAQTTRRASGETVGLICAEVAPALDPVELGTAIVGHMHAMDPVSVGVASSAGRRDLALEHAIVVALEGLDVARASGSTRAIHSELYDLAFVSTGGAGERQGEAIASDPPPLTEIANEPAPATEADDPFAQFIQGDGAIPLAHDLPALRAPARERAALSAEITSLQSEAATLRERDKHAHELLERRIAKLTHELESAESEIDRLRTEYEGERGLPSVYRDVQGLDETEPLAPLKKHLIDGLFRENEPD